MFKKFWLIIIFILPPGFLAGDTLFSDIDMTSDDKLSFNMTVDYPGFGTYQGLILSDLNTGKLTQLTFFPERIMYLADTGEFQIQNRFGVFRTDTSLTAFSSIDMFPSFINTNKLDRGKILPVQCSPDGKYLIYIDIKGYSYGDLTIFNVSRKKKSVISRDIELFLDKDNALWSEDSRFIIYTKESNLYYYSIEHLDENRVFAEGLRKVGKGALSSISWGSRNELYYVSGFLVYKIISREFFTRALYKDILRIGTIIGKIPFSFDPNFDAFWISPDGTKILLSKGGRNLFLYFLTSEDFISTGSIQSLPYLYLPRNSTVSKVIWSEEDQVTVLTTGIEKGKKTSTVFRLQIPASGDIGGFIQTADTGVTDIILSPGEANIAILKEDSVEIKSYDKWVLFRTVEHKSPMAAIWKDKDEIFIAGTRLTELYHITKARNTLITLSQGGEKGFSGDENSIYLKVDDQPYRLDLAQNTWQKAAAFQAKEPAVVSNSYRAYLTDSTAGGYSNMIMVRNIEAGSYGTAALFTQSNILQLEPFPEKEGKLDFDHFAHGSRIRRREVALVINVIDSVEGVTSILNVLSDFNLKCTFFINGEAIKRYSGAVKEIASSGHEIGSLFYAYFNMVDSKYNLDKNFIKMGLAINEDDYFTATGQELSLLWHAPYYFINSDIIQASKEMGYIYIGRDVDSMDWVTRDISGYTTGIYLPAVKLVDRILREKQPGSIIPVIAGIPAGDRDDYLFQKLDILINGLLNAGYDIVPVSTLIEHAR